MPDLDDVLDLVRAERERQTRILGDAGRPDVLASPAWPHSVKLAILVKVVGDLARHVQVVGAEHEDGVARELEQVAAVAVAWRESIR